MRPPPPHPTYRLLGGGKKGWSPLPLPCWATFQWWRGSAVNRHQLFWKCWMQEKCVGIIPLALFKTCTCKWNDYYTSSFYSHFYDILFPKYEYDTLLTFLTWFHNRDKTNILPIIVNDHVLVHCSGGSTGGFRRFKPPPPLGCQLKI